MTKQDLLPPNIIIPENWDKTPIKFLDFLEKTHTDRHYSYAHTTLENETFPIKLADLYGEKFTKEVAKIKVEQRPDGLYLTDIISSEINLYNIGLYSACSGVVRGDDVINCKFEYLFIPTEVETEEELKAILRDLKLKELGI